MSKPKKRTKKYWDWIEVKGYLEKKYPGAPWEKAWRFLMDGGDIHNGCYMYLPDDWNTDDTGFYPPHVKECLEILDKEGMDDGETQFWVWW